MSQNLSDSRITIAELEEYVGNNIDVFHENRLTKLKSLELDEVLRRKNPYLFKAKNILTAHDFVKTILDAYLASQEEGIFGLFLGGLAIFICGKVYGGKKSAVIGIDLEFRKEDVYYFVSIKSGPNWANSDQLNRMKQNFNQAEEKFKLSNPYSKVQCVNGCCYGKDTKPQKPGYLKLCGQVFWEFISGDAELFLDIIEPLGYKAKEKNEEFMKAYAQAINNFTYQFTMEYCINGELDWKKIIRFNSGFEKQVRKRERRKPSSMTH